MNAPEKNLECAGDLILSLAERQDRISVRLDRKIERLYHRITILKRAGAIAMTGRRSPRVTGIPLYPIPAAIDRQNRMPGGRMFRIHVKRTCRHHDNIIVRTKSLHRELRVPKSPSSAHGPVDNSDSECGSENS